METVYVPTWGMYETERQRRTERERILTKWKVQQKTRKQYAMCIHTHTKLMLSTSIDKTLQVLENKTSKSLLDGCKKKNPLSCPASHFGGSSSNTQTQAGSFSEQSHKNILDGISISNFLFFDTKRYWRNDY